MTLIELIVSLLIFSVLVGATVPLVLAQRVRSGDSSVQADLRRFATAAEKFYTTDFTYPATLSGLGDNGRTPTVSEGNVFRAYVIRSGANAGYVIYGVHDSSHHVFVISSYTQSREPVRTELSELPETPPAAGELGVGSGVKPSDWTSTAGIDSDVKASTRRPFTDPTFLTTIKDAVNASNIPLVSSYGGAPFRVAAINAPVATRGVEVVTDSATTDQGVILWPEAVPGGWTSAQKPVASTSETWTVSAWVKAPTGTLLAVGCRFAVPTTQAVKGELTTPYTATGEWQRIWATCSTTGGGSPSIDAVGAYVVPEVFSRSKTPGTTFYVTAPQVEEGPTASPFAVK